jgi:hypothetical protein
MAFERLAGVEEACAAAVVEPPSAGILTHSDAEIRRNVETNFLGPRS